MNLKTGLAEMLKGGVIMDVVNSDQAKIAEDSGAVAVMALERVPFDIRTEGGIARMAKVELIQEIMDSVSIPVMAKCRIGHFVEAQILQEIGVDYIDESEVLTPSDDEFHVNKHDFKTPFVCGAIDLASALRRIAEGAALIRTKGEPGTGNVIEAVKHIRTMNADLVKLINASDEELALISKSINVPKKLLELVRKEKTLPVPNFAAGGISTPADAALMMQLGAEAIFVGSGIFKSENPAEFAKGIVKATTRFNEPSILLEASFGLLKGMKGIESVDEKNKMSKRGF
jgi:pyridoxal 5'-phosphate synthase pdxS subunit